MTCDYRSQQFATFLAVSRCHTAKIRPPGPCRSLAVWMQTTGACQVGTSLAGSQRCLRSRMRAVVCPRCCTFCCTDLSLTCQGNSVRLPSATPALLALIPRLVKTMRHVQPNSHDDWADAAEKK